MLYEDHAIATGGLSFTELKQRSLINERARVGQAIPICTQHRAFRLPLAFRPVRLRLTRSMLLNLKLERS